MRIKATTAVTIFILFTWCYFINIGISLKHSRLCGDYAEYFGVTGCRDAAPQFPHKISTFFSVKTVGIISDKFLTSNVKIWARRLVLEKCPRKKSIKFNLKLIKNKNTLVHQKLSNLHAQVIDKCLFFKCTKIFRGFANETSAIAQIFVRINFTLGKWECAVV